MVFVLLCLLLCYISPLAETRRNSSWLGWITGNRQGEDDHHDHHWHPLSPVKTAARAATTIKPTFQQEMGVSLDASTIYKRLWQEEGFTHMIAHLESLVAVEWRGVGARANWTGCVTHAMVLEQPHLVDSPNLCLPRSLLDQSYHPITFEQFLKGPMEYNQILAGEAINSGYDAGMYCDGSLENAQALRNRSFMYLNTNSGKRIETLRRMLPVINVTFFLVHCGDHARFDKWMLRSKKILKIFACNVPVSLKDHPKISPFPLGLKRQKSHSTLTLARRQISRTNPTQGLFVKFSINSPVRRARARKALLLALKRHGLLMNPANVPKTIPLPQFYRSLMRHRFVVSPQGNGIDCYRTWEALALGRPPIIMNDQHPFLYQDLPVVVVDRWERLNSTRLAQEWMHLSERTYNANKILRFWWALYIVIQALATP
eukprot:NODE_2510_length_1401_cov_101.417840_g2386_i0.p1 GENE.NODE_2510_length_1401_cov_101.417840_g2386_i0~~NODE_2510_length_1401_cov_101.417840_g2386_i0.p1  ORF type:complete len:449 (+),score=28.77 NODE_2510_length_1401_cov_101.417840_g2386_i0:58-1347(+)